ncbi:Ig-like domain-containing protein [Lewinella sp. LCG006]|uniref:Ig-like domain-containing protein n=1 Tax=Lewinella sp. LCG006 TaxID=3231911 RepID=UPI003460E1D3
MNVALQKLFVLLALMSLPFWGWSQSVSLLTYQNSGVNYDFTSRPNSPSLPGAFLPDNGTVELINNGNWEYTVVYTPNEGFTGTDNFRIVRWVIDPIPAFRTVDVTVTVAPALIKAYHDYAVTYTNQPVVVDVLANDISSNGVKVLQAVPAINHGSATFNATTGLISFTPEAGFRGTAHFNYALCNGVGDCDDGTVSITVMEETPPTQDEVIKVFVKKNQTQFILVPGNYAVVQGPANGVFDPGADVPEYTPAQDYFGNDEIILSDGNHNLTFDIEVLDLETNSFAFDDRAFTTTNTAIDIVVLGNDLPLTGCSLNDVSGPDHGTLQQSGNEFTYTPDPGFIGVDQFSYSSNICGSGAASEVATVTIFVSNFAPDRTTFHMATPKTVPMIIGYNVPVSTFSFEVTSQGELGETIFLEGEVNTIINGLQIQGNNILLYIPNEDVTEDLDEIEITYCLEDPNSTDCLVSKQVKIWMTILDIGDNGEPVCVGDCVWAGDTNADGIVNMNDLLPIGRSMGEIGAERVGATFDQWYGQYAEDWGSLFGGNEAIDIKHIDADGNSIVTAEDTIAIRSFYGRTHNMVPSVMPYAPYEFILEGPLFVNPGDYVEFTISVGTPEAPAEDLYGFVFPFVYNPDAVRPSSVTVNWHDNNFLAYDSPVLFMNHNDFSGRFDAGYTRTSGLVASGHGELGTLGIVIDDIQGFRSEEEEILLTFGGETGSSLDQFGEYNSVYVRPFQVRVRLRPEDETLTQASSLDDLLKTYPNPTSEYLNIHLNGQQAFEQITLRTMTGQVVHHQETSGVNHAVLSVAGLTPGMYILSVTSDKGTINRKIEILR